MGVWDIYFTYRFITQLDFRARDEFAKLEFQVFQIMTSLVVVNQKSKHKINKLFHDIFVILSN